MTSSKWSHWWNPLLLHRLPGNVNFLFLFARARFTLSPATFLLQFSIVVTFQYCHSKKRNFYFFHFIKVAEFNKSFVRKCVNILKLRICPKLLKRCMIFEKIQKCARKPDFGLGRPRELMLEWVKSKLTFVECLQSMKRMTSVSIELVDLCVQLLVELLLLHRLNIFLKI